MFIYSFLINLAFVGAGFSIDFSKVDNASKMYSQLIYFTVLFVLALLGNIAVMTKNAVLLKKGVNLFDFSVGFLSITAGTYGFFRFGEPLFSYFTILCLFIFIIGVIGVVRSIRILRQATV